MEVVDYCGTGDAGEKRCAHTTRHKWAGIEDTYSWYKALGVKNYNRQEHMIHSYNFSAAYLLKDGSVVYMGALWSGPWIVVDVNNFQKKPNEIGRDVFIIKIYSSLRTNQHWIKPAGALNTPTWNDPQSGSYGCSPDIGKKSSIYIYDVAGAGCSAKYLLK